MPKSKKTKNKNKNKDVAQNIVEFYNGTNTFNIPNGDIYIGEFCAHVSGLVWREGHGVYYSTDGQTYEGEWKDDKLIDNSEVTINYEDGNAYTGPLVKNKYNGSGLMKLESEMKVFAQFNANKVVGDVLMADLDGKLWHGVAVEDRVYLQPENIFFQNIHKHRGKSKEILKNIKPEFSQKLFISNQSDSSPQLTNRELEQIIFAKSNKTQLGIDFNNCEWYKNFLKYKSKRSLILSKVKSHTPLTRDEGKWYMQYHRYKKMNKNRDLELSILKANNQLCTSLLDRFYSDAFKKSSQPYSVFYPTYDWVVPTQSVEEFELPDYLLVPSVEEEEYHEVSVQNEPIVTEHVKSVVDDTRTVLHGTSSMFDYIDTNLETEVSRECNNDKT